VSEAVRLSTMLRDLVDVLIPGEGDWPSGSLAGVHGILGMRLLEELGEPALTDVEAALEACGGPLGPLSEEDRVTVVARLETSQPKLFTLIRTAAYLGYYESPSVIPQIRALGQPYDPVPIFRGYHLEPFDRDRDRPRHNRGFYIPTDQVQPVDISGLDHLGERHGRA
jgi:hypothetical protein